jgi:hypothetical protein
MNANASRQQTEILVPFLRATAEKGEFSFSFLAEREMSGRLDGFLVSCFHDWIGR